MSDAELRELPITRFWLYSKNIDRISSEFDMRLIRVSLAKGSQEAFEDTQKSLKIQMGSIIEFEAETKQSVLEIKTDPGAIAELAMLAGQRLGDVL